MEKAQAKKERWLLVGPWNHYQTYSQRLHCVGNGERKMPANASFDLIAQRLLFFDRFLKGDKSIKYGDIQKDRVKVYITGANIWKDAPTFPIPDTKILSLYLHSQADAHDFPQGGILSTAPPLSEPEDVYIYDPTLPPFYQPLAFQDNRELEIRADVLTYTSSPLTHPTTILGEITLRLYAATDGSDTDWFALVTEVFPDGQSIAFHGPIGTIRARYHEGLHSEALLAPNEPMEFLISLGPAGHQIAVGNRLRLSIFSAAFPAYDPNTNTGNTVATDTEQRTARQTIFHTQDKPSVLQLPIVELE